MNGIKKLIEEEISDWIEMGSGSMNEDDGQGGKSLYNTSNI